MEGASKRESERETNTSNRRQREFRVRRATSKAGQPTVLRPDEATFSGDEANFGGDALGMHFPHP